MAYERRHGNLISRPGPSDLSGGLDKLWGTLKTGVKSAVNFYGQAQRDAGAAAAAAQAPVVQYAQPTTGISTNTVLMAGGAALLLVVLLKRKS